MLAGCVLQRDEQARMVAVDVVCREAPRGVVAREGDAVRDAPVQEGDQGDGAEARQVPVAGEPGARGHVEGRVPR